MRHLPHFNHAPEAFGLAGALHEEGSWPMARILPSLVQEWVTKAIAEGLAPRSVHKYHVMLHPIFERAVRDQLILINPCEHAELPKIIVRSTRTLPPDEFARLIAPIPERHRLHVASRVAIKPGVARKAPHYESYASP